MMANWDSVVIRVNRPRAFLSCLKASPKVHDTDVVWIALGALIGLHWWGEPGAMGFVLAQFAFWRTCAAIGRYRSLTAWVKDHST